jgi:hypothetical protein
VRRRQQTSALEFEELTAVSPIYEKLQKTPRYLLGSSAVPQRLVSGVVSLIVASIIAVTCIVFWTRIIFPPPDDQPPLASTSSAKDNSSDSLARTTTPSEDPRRWLGQWAGFQRTRDAKSQASFYADEGRPYLRVPKPAETLSTKASRTPFSSGKAYGPLNSRTCPFEERVQTRHRSCSRFGTPLRLTLGMEFTDETMPRSGIIGTYGHHRFR